MELRNRLVHFKICDVYIPDPQTLLLQLHGDDILHGKVVDLSDGGTEEATFAIVDVEGITQSVIIPTGRILEIL